MLDILFGSKIGILTVVTVVFGTVMVSWMGWKFAQLSKQPPEDRDE